VAYHSNQISWQQESNRCGDGVCCGRHLESAHFRKFHFDRGRHFPERRDRVRVQLAEGVASLAAGPECTSKGAEKPVRLALDIGEDNSHGVVGSIEADYDPAQPIARLTVMVTSPVPRKMKSGLAKGMVLAASDADGKTGGICLLAHDSGTRPSIRVR